YAGMATAGARRGAAAGPAAVARLPARVDAPGWLWRSWERAYGAATARAIAAAHRLEAPLDVTLKDPSETARWAEALDAAPIGVGSLRLNARRDVASAPGFGAGAWWVQDAAAAMPAAALRAAMGGDIAGKRVVDLCAAPGGKTMQLASMGADVIAVDVSGPRLKRVAENLQRVGLKATTVKADALDWSPETPADAVLLDAPCAATGTIRRHPDVAWSKTEDDVAALAKIQTRLLARAAEMTAPGGIVVYCVCSLQRDEGEARIEAALKAEARYARVPIDPATLGDFADAVTRRGDVRTTPASLASRGGCDGFYVAALRVGDVD
ncbi:MAG: RsmB/NOP family class I SAM-dependent RNA methyltransferase, partial [Parvularculaceae bacterium]